MDRNRKPGLTAFLLYAATALFVALGDPACASAAGTNAIAVVYPDIGEPYREIFEKMIQGIDDKINGKVASYPVSADTNVKILKTTLQRQNVRVIIALGRQGMNAALALNNGFKMVVGGVLSMPDIAAPEGPVVSLTPDPGLLFEQMKSIMPSIKRVYVVYDPRSNEWLIKLAQDEARAQGIELVGYKAQDLRSAVGFYEEVFAKANSRSDALWLPQDSTTVEDSTVLPLVLQESWNRSLAVFSSNFNYVKRGLLLSLYPDNTALGSRLAALAQDILSSGEYGKHGLMPLRDVQSAVNLRTANHLGLSATQRQSFDLTYPAQ